MMMDYQAVDPAYKTLLRAVILIDTVLLLILFLMPGWLIPSVPLWPGALAATLVVLGSALLTMLWVPKRYRFTGYAVQPLTVHFRTGALWRTQTVVTLNRIQHVEITQGPLERWLKLARLVIYTAGGKTSDLTVPGLPLTTAESIRDGLLRELESQPGRGEGTADDTLDLREGIVKRTQLTLDYDRIQQADIRQPWFFLTLAFVTAVALFSRGDVLLTGVAALVSASLSALFVWVSWRHRAIFVSDDWLALRYGMIGQQQRWIPAWKMQTLRIRQGPWLRRWGMSALHVYSAAGRETIAWLPSAQIEELQARLMARTAAHQGRWM
jgi:uncharacterized protein